MIVNNVILPLFKGNPEIKVKNSSVPMDQLGGVLLYWFDTVKYHTIIKLLTLLQALRYLWNVGSHVINSMILNNGYRQISSTEHTLK